MICRTPLESFLCKCWVGVGEIVDLWVIKHFQTASLYNVLGLMLKAH